MNKIKIETVERLYTLNGKLNPVAAKITVKDEFGQSGFFELSWSELLKLKATLDQVVEQKPLMCCCTGTDDC